MKKLPILFIIHFSFFILFAACRSSRETLQMNTQLSTVKEEQRTTQLSILAMMDSMTYFVQQQTNTLSHQLRDSTHQVQAVKKKEPTHTKGLTLVIVVLVLFLLILLLFFVFKKMMTSQVPNGQLKH